MDPQDLYQDVILRHSREPAGFERREDAGLVIEAYNPLCGDQFRLFLDIEGDRIVRASFYGYGCAISKASTSVLVQRLPGLSLDEAGALIREFFAVVREGESPPENADPELLAFSAARHFPARLSCATLSWEALDRFLASK